MSYDKHYQTENLFGDPYPELVRYFEQLPFRGKVLDLGCGQGRDALAIARLGYKVVGIDNSKVGIDQMNTLALKQNLKLQGILDDIYSYRGFEEFDIILLDSMFHFQAKDREKETGLVQRVLSQSSMGTLIVICIQDNGDKVQILKDILEEYGQVDLIHEEALQYTYIDRETDHRSVSDYRMIVAQK